jgi:hypothetical protein
MVEKVRGLEGSWLRNDMK